MNILLYILVLVALIIGEFIYLRVAEKQGIHAYPSHRSAHTTPIVTGGGIIFYLAILLYVILCCLSLLPPPNQSAYITAFIGITLITAISFKDDISEVPTCIRLMIHIVGILFISSQAGVFSLEWYFALIAIICGIGFINIYNFMDGIAGITGSYSIVVLASIYYINAGTYIASALIIFLLIAALVFCIFNFRSRELCFCGDTGALTMGASIFFILTTIIIASQNALLLILVIVYGIDSTLTIIYRIIDRENIFRAHNRHIYQLLTNKWRFPHLIVASIYASLQAIITIGYICIPATYQWIYVAIVAVILITIYITIAHASARKRLSFDQMKAH